MWTFWRREKSLLLGVEPPFLSLPACSIVTVPSVLAWLGGNQVVGEKCVALPICPSQIPHGLCQNHTWGSAMKGQPWHSLLGLGTECSSVGFAVCKVWFILKKKKSCFMCALPEG
jgi:hypothetical protein